MQDAEILDRIREIAAALFRKPGLDIRRETVAGDVDGWDSLAHALLLLRVEKAFDVKLSDAERGRIDCVGDIVDLVKAKSR